MNLRNLVCASTVALALGLPTTAQAALFTLDGFTVNVPSDPGLALYATPLVSSPYQFSLTNVGDTHSVDLFTLGTTEDDLNADDFAPRLISVDYSFSAPPPPFGGSDVGLSAGFIGAGPQVCFGRFCITLPAEKGGVVWGDPAYLSFGTTGLLSITLENVTFDVPGSAPVQATFRLERANVPEPATLLLLGMGAVVAGARRYRTSRRTN